MRIGTYNLKFLFDEGTRLHSGQEHLFTPDFVEKRVEFFASQFNLLNADILFLQELGDESVLQKILEKTDEKYSYFLAEPDKHGVGNAVIYKEDIQCQTTSIPTSSSLPVFNDQDSDGLGPRIWSRRDYVKVVTQYEGVLFVLVGLHIKAKFMLYANGLSSPESPDTLNQVDAADATIRSEFFRLSQAKKLREIVSEVFAGNPDSYMVVLGDFNARETDELLKVVLGKIKDRDDVLIHAHGSETIDHILVSKLLESHISKKEIYTESVFPDGSVSVESDHAPLILELKN